MFREGDLVVVPMDSVRAVLEVKTRLTTGYAGDPIRPVLLLMRNLMGRNFQASVLLDAMQNYLRTPAPRVLPEGLTWRSRVELGATSRDYLMGAWQVTMEHTDSDDEGGARKRALDRIARTQRWLASDDPW